MVLANTDSLNISFGFDTLKEAEASAKEYKEEYPEIAKKIHVLKNSFNDDPSFQK